MNTFSYVVERKIETFPIEENIVAYRDVSVINGREISVYEGIATMEAIESVNDEKAIKGLNSHYLFKEEVVEMHRHQNIFHHQEDMNSVVIKEPYSYLTSEGKENVLLLRIAINSHDLYFTNEERLMKPVYFDNANGLICDEYYDLDGIFEKLQYHPNLIWGRSRTGSCRISTYNGYGLKFHLVPTKEIWEEIKGFTSSFDLQEYVKVKILDIEQFKKQEENY